MPNQHKYLKQTYYKRVQDNKGEQGEVWKSLLDNGEAVSVCTKDMAWNEMTMMGEADYLLLSVSVLKQNQSVSMRLGGNWLN